jgi:hypothetical protein
MSTLSQFAPFAGGGLKSFQTGYVQSGASSGSVAYNNEDVSYYDVTVSSVNTSKAITGFQGTIRAFDGLSTLQAYGVVPSSTYMGIVTTRMTSSTNIRMATVAWSSPYISGRWQIAEAN